MGQFNFKQIGLYGRPIYQNSGGRYLFYSDLGQWMVSLTNVNMSYIKLLKLKRISNIMIVFDLICLQTGWYKLQ